VAQNCIKIMRDVDKTEPLSDGFTHFQLVQKTMNTCTHLYSCIVCHTIHECKYNFTSPRAILNGVAHSYRYNHRKIYTPERYSRFFPSLGPGWLRFDGDHAPKDSCFWWLWFDPECPRAYFCQGRYVISIPEIGRFLTPRETITTHDPDSWTTPHFLNFKTGYDILVNKHNFKLHGTGPSYFP
jgi:hypothetical protein